jgi:hypothetical protein
MNIGIFDVLVAVCRQRYMAKVERSCGMELDQNPRSLKNPLTRKKPSANKAIVTKYDGRIDDQDMIHEIFNNNPAVVAIRWGEMDLLQFTQN